MPMAANVPTLADRVADTNAEESHCHTIRTKALDGPTAQLDSEPSRPPVERSVVFEPRRFTSVSGSVATADPLANPFK